MRCVLFLFLSMAAAMVLCAGGAEAQFTMRDSSAFTYQYNGDAYPVPGYTENDHQGGWFPSSDGDILSWCIPQINLETPEPYFDSDDWASLVSNAVGHTVEIRAKVGTDYEEGANGAFMMYAGDGTDSGGGLGYIAVGKETVKWYGTTAIASGLDNTSDFHTYRMAQGPDSTSYMVWRDTAWLGEFSKLNVVPQFRFFWGDGSSAIGGPTVYIDYVRFDNTGGYAPVGSTRKPGDANFDSFVDSEDAAILASNWLQSTTLGWDAGDFNDDEVVNDIDATMLATNWTGPPSGASVPEPAVITLLISMGLVLLVKKLRY